MDDALRLVLAVFGGVGLSVVMVGGLWWTLRRLPATRRPALFALASFWGRLAIAAAGLYLITSGDWRRAVAALLGFLVGRTILVRTLAVTPPAIAPEGA
jgi:F1F0 ATPase subunit 2